MYLARFFVHVGKRSSLHKRKNSKKQPFAAQMFLKIGVLKHLTIFTRKHLCLFLIKLQLWRSAFLLKKKTNSGIFLWILQNHQEQSFYRTPAHYTFSNFLDVFGYKIDIFSYFLCHCFVSFHNSSVTIGSPWLFFTCIYSKFFSKYKFCKHYNVRIRKNIHYYTNSS